MLANALNGGVSISCPGMLDFAEVRGLSFPLPYIIIIHNSWRLVKKIFHRSEDFSGATAPIFGGAFERSTVGTDRQQRFFT